MTAIVEVQLCCDGPGPYLLMDCLEHKQIFADSAKEARKLARADGWIQSRRKGKLVDICPGCQEVK